MMKTALAQNTEKQKTKFYKHTVIKWENERKSSVLYALIPEADILQQTGSPGMNKTKPPIIFIMTQIYFFCYMVNK